ncbi:glycosyltransferase family 4 protein [Microbacterium sp. ASV49]|uniref:D-inositol 3-phosphate glycosyltransferase n=1 Tax=Microbacterium candidum TaxID=3041922 RepID=A0ABT7MV03_9MICO|nr:glycosyltransferase family 4 protein [Microbacterium sp. ASV49]MDL9978280.1 glycosyltransferase family 4 protein [Microbacterium sp. ASV49]
MRVLHAIRSDGFAGVERYALSLAVAQAARGDEVHVIGGDPKRMRPALDAAGVAHTPAVTTADVTRAVRPLRERFDVVNSHMTAADLGAVLALRGGRSRPPIVSTRHFTSPRGTIGPIRIDALIGNRIDAEISISRAVAEAIGRPSTVVHSGVENVEDAGVSRQRIVLMAQRLEVEKRTDLGIRAFASSRLADSGWTLDIAGDGAQRVRLEALAAELGVSARFLGVRTDVPSLMQRAGVFLAPCTVEGLGLAVLEAMASGTPVVAADAGGHTEILDGLDPRALYEAEDPDAAARSLISLVADEPGRAALGAAVRERQRTEFSIAAQAAGTEAVYRAAIERRHH